MTAQQMAGQEPANQTETIRAAARDHGAISAARRRRNTLARCMVGMLPLSLLVALGVLLAMAAHSAAATGGCGGG